MGMSGFSDFALTYLMNPTAPSEPDGNPTGSSTGAAAASPDQGLPVRTSASGASRPRVQCNLPTPPSEAHLRPLKLHDLPALNGTNAGKGAQTSTEHPVHAQLIRTVERTLSHFRDLFHRGIEPGLFDGALDYDCIQATLAAFDDPGHRLVYLNSPRELAVWLDALDAQGDEACFSAVFRCDTEDTDHAVAIRVEHTAQGTTLDVIESLDPRSPHFWITRQELDDTLRDRPNTRTRHHSVPVQARGIGCPVHATHFALNAPAYLQGTDHANPFANAPDLARHAESIGRLKAVDKANIAKEDSGIGGPPPVATLKEYFDAHACPQKDRRGQPMSDSIERFRLDMLERTLEWLCNTPSERVLERMERVRPAQEGGFRALGLLPDFLRTGAEVSSFRKLPRHGLSDAARFWRREEGPEPHPQVPRPEPAHLPSERVPPAER